MNVVLSIICFIELSCWLALMLLSQNGEFVFNKGLFVILTQKYKSSPATLLFSRQEIADGFFARDILAQEQPEVGLESLGELGGRAVQSLILHKVFGQK